MTITIMIDGSITPNRMLGFELQSSHVIERCYKILPIWSLLMFHTQLKKNNLKVCKNKNCGDILLGRTELEVLLVFVSYMFGQATHRP